MVGCPVLTKRLAQRIMVIHTVNHRDYVDPHICFRHRLVDNDWPSVGIFDIDGVKIPGDGPTLIRSRGFWKRGVPKSGQYRSRRHDLDCHV